VSGRDKSKRKGNENYNNMENIFVGITGVGTVILVYHLLTKNEKTLKEEMSANRKEVAESEKRMRVELASLFQGVW
jgi:hypothetical protein